MGDLSWDYYHHQGIHARCDCHRTSRIFPSSSTPPSLPQHPLNPSLFENSGLQRQHPTFTIGKASRLLRRRKKKRSEKRIRKEKNATSSTERYTLSWSTQAEYRTRVLSYFTANKKQSFDGRTKEASCGCVLDATSFLLQSDTSFALFRRNRSDRMEVRLDLWIWLSINACC